MGEACEVPPTMMAPPPFGPGMMGTTPIPVGGPIPQQVTVMAPLSHRPSEYRSPTPDSRSPSRRAPSRYSDRDRFEPGFRPAPVGGPMPMPMPSTIHIGPTPYPSYPRSRGRDTLDHGHRLLNGIALSLLEGVADVAEDADLITQGHRQ